MRIFLGTVPDTPSGEGFPRQVRLCQGVPLPKQKSGLVDEERGSERERERKRKRGAWWHVVGPSRSESHAFRQSSVRRGAYRREQLANPPLAARFVRDPSRNSPPGGEKQGPVGWTCRSVPSTIPGIAEGAFAEERRSSRQVEATRAPSTRPEENGSRGKSEE